MPTSPHMAHVLTARRTPFAPVHGLLSGWHPVDLLAHAMAITVDDADISTTEVTHVLVGCAHPVGAQSANLGRAALLAAGWPEHIPATTIERGAGSSHRALQLAAQAVSAGTAELVVAAGVEVMSLVPPGAPGLNRQYGAVWGSAPARRYEGAGGLVPTGVAGDRLAAADALGRETQDREAARCRRLADTVDHPPWLVVTPTRCNDRDRPRAEVRVLAEDEAAPVPPECPSPLHDDEGTVAATNIAPAADGAAVAVLASDGWVRSHDRRPVASIVATAEAAVDPVTMFGAAPAALDRALAQVGLHRDRIELVELDAPHAAAALHLARVLELDDAGHNRTGGGLGRGRPLGAIGIGMLAEMVGWTAHTGARPGMAALLDESDDGSGTATIVAPFAT